MTDKSAVPSSAAPQDLRGEERARYIHEHDCPKAWEFFNKHSLGSKLCPSCLKCGKVEPDRERWAIKHMELPDIYICADCCAPSSIAPEPVAYRWKWDKGLEWHYGDYLVPGRDYHEMQPLYTAPGVGASSTAGPATVMATSGATYDAIADAVNEVATEAHTAFVKAGLDDIGDWDGDDIVKDVKRGIVAAIERLSARSATRLKLPEAPYPRSPAAFINAIAEEGDKAEAIKYLQETWDELVAIRRAIRGEA